MDGSHIGTDPYSAAWHCSNLHDSQKQQVVSDAHVNGALVLVSAGGAGYVAYTANGANAFGQGAATFCIDNHLDGVDFDFENFNGAFGTPSGLDKQQTVTWLRDCNTIARTQLGTSPLITHAPQSPYLNIEFQNGYVDFLTIEPRPSVDYLLIQYYNQGATYTTYDEQFILLWFHPDTAVAQLISRGIAKEKIVVGRLTQASDGSADSWISPNTLGSWFQAAAKDPVVSNWKTGLSTWQWHPTGDNSPSSADFLKAVFS